MIDTDAIVGHHLQIGQALQDPLVHTCVATHNRSYHIAACYRATVKLGPGDDLNALLLELRAHSRVILV